MKDKLGGLGLVTAVSLVAWVLQLLELKLWGHAPLEGLVLAILLGMGLCSLRPLTPRETPGVKFAAKPLLEFAVVLLGASINAATLVASGPKLAGAVIGLVLAGIVIGRLAGQLLGLAPKLATLVACGNAICGNSAIAALAPVLEAEDEQVAASIAYTAILGIGLVLLLPPAVALLGLDARQGGILAGLTVYAVPQVLAAASAGGPVAIQIGTLVKLTRVLMLGPVVFFFALRHRRGASHTETGSGVGSAASWQQFVPPFILGFLLLAALRSCGLLDTNAAGLLREVAGWLTLAAMAGLGLQADLRTVRNAGRPVLLTALISLASLFLLALGLIRGLQL